MKDNNNLSIVDIIIIVIVSVITSYITLTFFCWKDKRGVRYSKRNK